MGHTYFANDNVYNCMGMGEGDDHSDSGEPGGYDVCEDAEPFGEFGELSDDDLQCYGGP